jgi:hypothetical protein
MQIHWGTSNDPLNGLTITWVNTLPNPNDSIQWGYTTGYEMGKFAAKRRFFSQTQYIYDFEFPTVNPSTTIHYSLKGVDWGPDRTFRTASDPSLNKMTFIAGGDSRDDWPKWKSISGIIHNEQADFHLFLADHVYKPDEYADWNYYFNYGNQLLSNNLLFHTGGNHDFGLIYLNQFVLPRNLNAAPFYERWYYFTHGNALFISMLTENNYINQHTWLLDVLETHKDKTWKVVFMHKPFFGTHSSGLSNEFDTWWKAFDDYGVDVVLAGHDHYYMRNKPINYNISTTSPVAEYGSRPGQGRLHIVSGGYGAGLMNVNLSNEWYVEASEMAYNYCRFEIDNNKLYMQALRENRTMIDSVIIEKEDTGIDRQPVSVKATANLTAFPNPFKASIRLNFPNPDWQAHVTIYNIQGRCVREYNHVPSGSVVWNGAHLANGVYTVKVRLGRKQYIQRILLQK